MKKIWSILIFGLLIISCNSKLKKGEFEKHVILLDFNVETKSPERLYQIESFKEEDYWDRPMKLKTQQKADTFLINFEIFEGGSTEIEGNIGLTGDTLELKIGKRIRAKELVIHEYQYKILNTKKVEYKIEIKNNIELEDL